MVTAVDAAGMLANIGQHGRLMRANIAYMRLQLQEHGERLLAVGGDLYSASGFGEVGFTGNFESQK